MYLFLRAEKLSDKLSEVKLLIDLYQKGDWSFPDRVIKWLEESEKLMGELRLIDGSELSTLRAQIVKVPDEQIARGGDRKRSVLRSAQNAATADALERAELILRGRVREAKDKLEHFDGKLAEAITTMTMGGQLPPRSEVWMNWIGQVWQGLVQCEETRGFSIYMSSSLSSGDRFYLLDQVLNRLIEGDKQSGS